MARQRQIKGNLSCLKLFICMCLLWRLAASFSVGHSQIRLERNPLDSKRDSEEVVQVDGGISDGENNSVSSLEELENKLDLILDSEIREKDLLEDLLHKRNKSEDEGEHEDEDGNVNANESEDEDEDKSSEEDLSTIPNPSLHVSQSPRRKLQVHVRDETNGERTITGVGSRSGTRTRNNLASALPRSRPTTNVPETLRNVPVSLPVAVPKKDGSMERREGEIEMERDRKDLGMGRRRARTLSMTETVDQELELEFGKVVPVQDEENAEDSDSNSMETQAKTKTKTRTEKEDKNKEKATAKANADYKLGSHGEKNNREDSSIIVKKLEENSERMETMVVFLADLRNVLSEAVASQEKQVALRGEVVELREEIDYLRKEVQKLRSEQVSHSGLKDPKLENKIHNDETTIGWLKESVKELRTGLEEVSSSVNVTGLVHLRQQWQTEVNRVDGDLRSLRNDVESLKGNQARDDEAILEIKGDIADLRTWHIKMGQKFLAEEQEQVITDSTMTEEKQWTSDKVTMDDTRMKLNFPFTDSVSNGKGGSGSRDARRNRHHRKLKAEMTNIENIVKDVVKDQTILHKRIVKLEKKMAKANKQEAEKRHRRNLVYFNDQQQNDIEPDLGMREEEEVSSSLRKTSRAEYGASNSFRINNLEKTVADYGNTVQHISDKVASLHELRESSTQLFTALEALETKYDERLTEMQTGLARMEASVSSTSITNDELREQQNLQSRVMQSLKKDFLGTRDQVQTNHLRLATVQSQLLKWGLKTCSDLSAESIQNIKIASLEAQLQQSSRSL